MDHTFWDGRPVLVTGATGFLGSHLVRELLDRGARVTVVRRPTGTLTSIAYGWLGAVDVVEGDVRDAGVVARALRQSGAATAFHLAALTQVAVANEQPAATYEANVQGTWTVLDACRAAPGLKQVVMASTDKVYGDQREMPLTEDMPLLAADPYNTSKICAEQIARSFASTYGLPVAMTRCANFYGPGDRNWRRIVPGTLRSILGGEAPRLRSDGRQVRDYMYVRDGAQATLRLAEVLAARPELRGSAYNVSAELAMTTLELVDQLQRRAGTDFEPIVGRAATHELDEQRLSAAKARAELGWTPQIPFEQGLDETITYYAELMNVPWPAVA